VHHLLRAHVAQLLGKVARGLALRPPHTAPVSSYAATSSSLGTAWLGTERARACSHAKASHAHKASWQLADRSRLQNVSRHWRCNACIQPQPRRSTTASAASTASNDLAPPGRRRAGRRAGGARAARLDALHLGASVVAQPACELRALRIAQPHRILRGARSQPCTGALFKWRCRVSPRSRVPGHESCMPPLEHGPLGMSRAHEKALPSPARTCT